MTDRRFRIGDRVRLSALGIARAGTMPEAWGVHRAATGGLTGEVIETAQADGDLPATISVEFPEGSVYNWETELFEPAGGQTE